MRSLTLILIICIYVVKSSENYTPDWESLDKRILPTWYDDAKVGIFIHWGVFAVPAFRSEWFWWDWQGDKPLPDVVDFMKKNYPPNFAYSEFAKEFSAENFEPDKWVEIFNASGAKYVVLTAKHHEGFCLWPSPTSRNWNSMDVGPNLDIVGELANSVRKNSNITFGLYHSLYEWFNPLYLRDKSSKFKSRDFIQSKIMPELHDLVKKYKPEIIWSDGDWETNDNYWGSRDFLAWLYNDSPVKNTVVVNDRWGVGDMCKHGDYFTCSDNYNPGTLNKHKWENCMPLDTKSWGFRRNIELDDILTIEQVIGSMVETVSCGGNILINVGPTKEGVIMPIFEERLRQLGSWLALNGEAIYGSRPWKYQNDTTNPNAWYTCNGKVVYATLLKYHGDEIVLTAPKVTESTTIELLGYSKPIKWTYKQAVYIDMSGVILSQLPSNWGLTFKLTNLF